jgi:hypothetical protein
MAAGSMTFLDVAEVVLQNSKAPLTPDEIWNEAMQSGAVQQLKIRGKTPIATLGARLYVDTRDNPNSKFVKVGARPSRFFLKSLAGNLPPQLLQTTLPAAKPSAKAAYSERDLHPFLVYFAHARFGAYCKTIYHERSKKGSSFNQWLHPDLAGLTLTTQDWKREVVEFSKQAGYALAKLYSFEIKMSLDFSNLREAFFQSVSNSSWANEGYIVIAELNENAEFQSELRRLSDSFGIGVINLDLKDPDGSEIVYSAREKSELDWETINKIAEQNPDFQDFMQAARNAVMVNKPNPADFDEIEDDAVKLIAMLKRKSQ